CRQKVIKLLAVRGFEAGSDCIRCEGGCHACLISRSVLLFYRDTYLVLRPLKFDDANGTPA
ncbi:hypothetical protein, partial [Burkholderia pseudomallei]|uniref:hypothetical protein n=1 Tax=Burkholderia pseudomallei TaxID=28450 RepID=UPI001C4DD888